MGYRIVAASWRTPGTPSAYEARTPAEALSKVRGLLSLGCEVTITGPDGEFVSRGELEELLERPESLAPSWWHGRFRR
jgi:hypothetical protein